METNDEEQQQHQQLVVLADRPARGGTKKRPRRRQQQQQHDRRIPPHCQQQLQLAAAAAVVVRRRNNAKQKSHNEKEIRISSLWLVLVAIGIFVPTYYNVVVVSTNRAAEVVVLSTTVNRTAAAATTIASPAAVGSGASDASRLFRVEVVVPRVATYVDSDGEVQTDADAAASALLRRRRRQENSVADAMMSAHRRTLPSRKPLSLSPEASDDYERKRHDLSRWDRGRECNKELFFLGDVEANDDNESRRRRRQQQHRALATCNLIHERSLQDVVVAMAATESKDRNLILGQGNWNSAWLVREEGGGRQRQQHMLSNTSSDNKEHWNNEGTATASAASSSSYVFRTHRIVPKFTDERDVALPKLLEQNRVDALVLERMSGGPTEMTKKLAVAPFAYCGTALATEAGASNLMDEYYRSTNYDKVPRRKRLELGLEVAAILAEIHRSPFPGTAATTKDSDRPAFVHGDFGRTNLLVSVDGRLKINDFNQGTILRYYSPGDGSEASSGLRRCKFSNERNYALPLESRPPERVNNTGYVDLPPVDVFAMGIVLIELLLGEEKPFQYVMESRKEMRQPRVLPLPTEVYRSNDTADLALLYAGLACFSFRPEDRPTASRVRDGLRQALAWYDEGETTVSAERTKRLFLDRDDRFAEFILDPDDSADDDSTT